MKPGTPHHPVQPSLVRAAMLKLLIVLSSLGTTTAQAGMDSALVVTGSAPLIPEVAIISHLETTTDPLKQSLSELYRLRNYQLIWSDGTQYNENAAQLVNVIEQANKFGLNAKDYDLDLLQTLLSTGTPSSNQLAKNDVAFSQAYVRLASHVHRGRVGNQQSFSQDEVAMLSILNEAANNQSIDSAINRLQPNNQLYLQLLSALNRYQQFTAQPDYRDEPVLLTERSYEEGDYSSEIPKLRMRLQLLGDYTETDISNELYDQTLATAVQKFQNRHGLNADGIFGRQTAEALNVPIWQRIHQLELNLSRAQNLPDLSAGRHLLVNIPAYTLYVYDNEKLTYQSGVVVGKKKHATPVLSSELTKIVLSPYWNVPKSIAYNEIIPALRRDPQYLAKNNMRLLSTTGNGTQFINPGSIDWFNLDQTDLRFRIRQEPGVGNSLGNIKFFFPNAYSVYLHDTPSKHLFALPQRAFSHGCIRLEDPFGLAATLISDQHSWSKQDLVQLTEKSRSKTVTLTKAVPIHITYMTAWVDDQGIVNFRPDIYNRDSQLLANLYNADF